MDEKDRHYQPTLLLHPCEYPYIQDRNKTWIAHEFLGYTHRNVFLNFTAVEAAYELNDLIFLVSYKWKICWHCTTFLKFWPKGFYEKRFLIVFKNNNCRKFEISIMNILHLLCKQCTHFCTFIQLHDVLLKVKTCRWEFHIKIKVVFHGFIC